MVSATGETAEKKKPPSELEKSGTKQVLGSALVKIRDLYSVVKRRGIKIIPEKILKDLFPQKSMIICLPILILHNTVL